MNVIQRLYASAEFRRFIFWLGSVRRLQEFPWVTWDNYNPVVSQDEIDQMVSLLQPGDVGVHKNVGFLSNLFIPGEFKHVWIHVENEQIIEATASGVNQKSARVPLTTDQLVILRPKVSDEVKQAAVARAKNIVGFKYDVAFDFDLQTEFEHLDKYHQAFSCIETVAYAYYPQFKELGFEWSTHLGKQVLYPGTVVNPAWDVVWSNVPSIKPTL